MMDTIAIEADEQVRSLATKDRFMERLGVKLVECGPGRATVRMTVSDDHLNFNGTCHGGVIFSLADTAFGLASNSHGPMAAGINAHIAYTKPVNKGEILIASALEVSRSKRLGTYLIEVRRQDTELAATFTGTVFIMD